MSENQQSWMDWARMLQRWGIKGGVAAVLENAGSLSVLLAQVIYLCQPLLSGAVSQGTVSAFTRVLENPEVRHEFITFLREAPSSGTGA